MYPIAAPSCVLPANVAENAHFLAHKVQEVGLYFFESKACLAYTEEDLPLHLQALPLQWHVHLPVDLPWSVRTSVGKNESKREKDIASKPVENAGIQLCGKRAAKQALAVFAKAAYLRPRYAVLHPPTFVQDVQEQGRILQDFLQIWHTKTACPVLLENLQDMPLYTLPSELFFQEAQGLVSKKSCPTFGVCLDVGHMLAFGQEEFLKQKALLKKVRLVHWSAPGVKDDHKPLTALEHRQKDTLQKLMPLLPTQCTHMLEIFQWQGIEDSVPLLQKFLAYAGAKDAHSKK